VNTEVTPAPTRAGTVPWPPDVAARYAAEGYWGGRPLIEHVHMLVPDGVALVDGATRLTYRELMARADGLAARLYGLGLRADDRIVVQLPNSWQFVVLTLACLRLGVVPVMALPAHRRHEITYLVEHAEARAVAVPGVVRGFDHQEMAELIAGDCPTLRHILVVADDVRHVDLTGMCSPGPAPDVPSPDSASVAVFLLSGGTTGLPKLIARTHDDYAYNAIRAGEVSGFGVDTVYLAVLPMSHNFPLACPGVLGALVAGGRTVIAPSLDPAKVFPLIEREGVTLTSVVPAVAQRWLDFRAEDDSHDLGSLRVLQVGGARLADEVARRVRPLLGATVQQVFGMAEGLLNYTRLDDPDEITWHTQGRPMCPADELRVVDEFGDDVPAGEPGVLLTRGPYTPRGYYRAAEQNLRAFTSEGWYRTGDIVRLRPDGNLVVEGRDKDMINRGGEKVSAEEVENLVYQLADVSMVAAIAMPDTDLGERVCVYVVPRGGAAVTLEQMRDAMESAGAARFKWPEHLVLVESLPATKVGKIDKKALRADIVRRLGQEGQPPSP
jgi:2,3-dihydroxybenzoate-AMP ligase